LGRRLVKLEVVSTAIPRRGNMVRRVVILLVAQAVFSLLFSLAGCASSEVKPGEEATVVEEPVKEEAVVEKTQEEEKEKEKEKEEEEKPAAEKPEPEEKPDELELTEGEKRAKAELEETQKKAESLAAQLKFDEALMVIEGIIKKYKGSPIVEEARRVKERILKEKEKEMAKRLLEAARACYEETLEKCRQLIQQGKYAQALRLVDDFPEKFRDTEFAEKIARKTREIEKLLEKQRKEQQLLEEAKKAYFDLQKEVQELIETKEFRKAIEKIKSFPERLMRFGYEEKVARLLDSVEYRKKKRDNLRMFIDEARSGYDAALKKVNKLTAQHKYDEAADLVNSARTQDDVLTVKIQKLSAELREPKYIGFKEEFDELAERIESEKATYAEEMFQKAAKEAYTKGVGEADALVKENRVDEALAKLDTYPEEYKNTRWVKNLANKRKQIEADKSKYENWRKHIRDAKEEARKRIAEARNFAENNEFDRALALLHDYPQEYGDTDSKALVEKEIKRIEELQEEYKRRQTKTGIIIAIVIVILLVIVIAASLVKKGKGKDATSVAAETQGEGEETTPSVEEENQQETGEGEKSEGKDEEL